MIRQRAIMRPALTALLLAGVQVAGLGGARAETLVASIGDSAIRRRVDLVYIEHVPGWKPVPASAVVAVHGGSFTPRWIPVVLGTKVRFQSDDPDLHRVLAWRGAEPVLARTLLPGQDITYSFRRPGSYLLRCEAHPEMTARVLVLQNPFFARPHAHTGRFVLRGVPPGTYAVRVWGEALTDEEMQRREFFTVGASTGPTRLARR